MAKYRCENCGNSVEQEDLPSRCTSCLRQSLFILEKDKTFVSRNKRRVWFAIAIVSTLFMLGVLWNFSINKNESTEEHFPTVLNQSALLDQIKQSKIEPAEHYLSYFFSLAVQKWIQEEKLSSSASPKKVVETFISTIKKTPQSSIEHFSDDRFLFSAKFRNFNELINKKNPSSKSYFSLELAVAITSLLRALDHQVFVAQVIAPSKRRRPYDPSGKLGYFIVGVAQGNGKAPQPEWLWIDPLRQMVEPIEVSDIRLLSDKEILAALFNHQAALTQIQQGDASQALNLSEQSIGLDPRSAPARSNRGFILASSGGIQEGIKELQAATQLQAISCIHHAYASLLLLTGEIESAHKKTIQAIQQHPDFSEAHSTLATIMLMRGNFEKTKQHLLKSESLAGGRDSRIHVIWANYYLAQNELENASNHAEKMVQENPNSWQTHLQATQIFKVTNNLELAQTSAKRALELAPVQQKEQLQALFQKILGEDFLGEKNLDTTQSNTRSLEKSFLLKKPAILKGEALSEPSSNKSNESWKPRFHLLDP